VKWISKALETEAISVTTAEELDHIEEQLWSAHKLIKHIANHTWDDEHRIACQQWMARYPEPEEEPCSQE
jgi:hypothetical protein